MVGKGVDRTEVQTLLPSLLISFTESCLQPKTRRPEFQAPVHWNIDHSVISWPKSQANFKVPQGKEKQARRYATDPRIKFVLFFFFMTYTCMEESTDIMGKLESREHTSANV